MIGASSPTIEVLTSMWARILRRSAVAPNENFFELGGDRAKAEALLAELSARCGRKLSPLLIYLAPTITTLGTLLERGAAPLPALLPMKSGAENPAVFITHGLGDTVLGLDALARKMRVPQAVYGMQMPGVDGLAPAMDRIEDMAAFFVAAIRQVRAHGPYILIGYSLGGLIALEMARSLFGSGDKIALLAMLDSYPDRRYLSLGQRLRLESQLVARRVGSAIARGKQKSPGDQDADFAPCTQLLAAMERVKEAQYRALRNYRPRFYDGDVKFMRAAIPSYFPDNAAAVWSQLVGKLEVETIPGNHFEMLTTNVERLAAIVTRYVSAATGK